MLLQRRCHLAYRCARTREPPRKELCGVTVRGAVTFDDVRAWSSVRRERCHPGGTRVSLIESARVNAPLRLEAGCHRRFIDTPQIFHRRAVEQVMNTRTAIATAATAAIACAGSVRMFHRQFD